MDNGEGDERAGGRAEDKILDHMKGNVERQQTGC
jgi:hypothetical protein